LPDGRHAISGSADRTLKLWDLVAGREIRTFSEHGASVNAVRVAHEGRHVLSASSDRTLKLWDVQTGKLLHTLESHRSAVLSFDVTVDGAKALSGSADGTLIYWDVLSFRKLWTLATDQGWVWEVRITPDGRRALTTSPRDSSVKLWDLQSRSCVMRIPVDTEPTSLCLLPGGTSCLVGDKAGNLSCLDILVT
jgi:WD40 repeat protein